MKVRSKTVYDATQITEGMVRGTEPLPSGIRLARRAISGDGRLLYYDLVWDDDDGYKMSIKISNWWVAGDGLCRAMSDAEFREEFEELFPVEEEEPGDFTDTELAGERGYEGDV